MNEMKFLLVGMPREDSVWLHLDKHHHAGISFWHKGKLEQLHFPADWLTSRLWIIKIGKFPSVEKIKFSGPVLKGIVDLSLKHIACATINRNHALLATCMCSIYGHQLINGAPSIAYNVEGTLGRMLARESFTDRYYMLGITDQQICKSVLQ